MLGRCIQDGRGVVGEAREVGTVLLAHEVFRMFAFLAVIQLEDVIAATDDR